MSNPISHQPLTGSVLTHHVHSENEPLPGARGAAPAVDYTPETIQHIKLPPSEEGDTQNFTQHKNTEHRKETPVSEPETHIQHPASGPETHNHLPASQAPTGKVKLGDKIVGKTQEVSLHVNLSIDGNADEYLFSSLAK